MKLIVLSGGSGTRLWPLSHASMPKQFLRILVGPNGQLESMVERLWRQLAEVGLQESVYYATGQEQAEQLRGLLGMDVQIILEPEQRDTFPAVALTATYLYSMADAALNETVVIVPVDSFVDTEFFQVLLQLDDVLEQTNSNFALIAVKPDHPSEKYGYLVPAQAYMTEPKQDKQQWWEVARFHEKPSRDVAKQLIAQGALWNCGVFAFRLDYLINLLIEKGLPLQYEEMVRRYGQLKKTSFDYEVVEQASLIVAQTYMGKWKDIGTWGTLSEEMTTTTTGRGYIAQDCQNTHVINHLDIPIGVIGLDNVIIVAGPEGIIVADKSDSHLIKTISSQFELDKTKKV